MTRADLVEMCMKSVASARRVIEIAGAGADTSAIAQLCSTLASALVETLEMVAQEDPDDTEGAADSVKVFVRQYQGHLHVATAALLETLAIEARLRVVEAQLGGVMAQLASQSHIDPKLH